MHYATLLEVYQALEKTTKRLEKATILAKLFKQTPVEDLKEIVYLAQGRVFPGWSEEKIGFSDKILIKTLAHVYGTTTTAIEKAWGTTGDLGKVAQQLATKKNQQTLFNEPLTTHKVFSNIRKLARLQGIGTVNKKVQLVSELLSNATPAETRFIVGTVLEVLRIGVAEGIIRDALAEAFNLAAEDIEKANDMLVDYGAIAELAAQ
ncbi:MAG: DNA ligase, partial [Nanoarchaeota archaeon]|nr:DNA ligase [Nanoarchaeota archaeon]